MISNRNKIKFSLSCDGKSIRTLEELRSNFSVEDILEYYSDEKQLLHRWLDVRGYKKELGQVASIIETDELEIIKKLINIFFGEDRDSAKFEEDVYIFKYQKEREKRIKEYKRLSYAADIILKDYFDEYNNLVNEIIENNTNMAFIKSAIKEIDNKYSTIYQLEHRKILYLFLDKAPLAIPAMLMNENMRKNYLLSGDETAEQAHAEEVSNVNKTINDDKNQMYNGITDMMYHYDTLKSILGDNLKEVSYNTDGNWDELEENKGKFMIIYTLNTAQIRASQNRDRDGILDSDDVNGKFVIIEGIDYRSQSDDDLLLYMEV